MEAVGSKRSRYAVMLFQLLVALTLPPPLGIWFCLREGSRRHFSWGVRGTCRIAAEELAGSLPAGKGEKEGRGGSWQQLQCSSMARCSCSDYIGVDAGTLTPPLILFHRMHIYSLHPCTVSGFDAWITFFQELSAVVCYGTQD